MDPPLTELPLGPVQILRNAELREYLSIALETLGLDEHLYGVIAQPHSTSFRWPAARTRCFRFAMLDGVTTSYPERRRRAEFGAFFAAAPAALKVGGPPRWSERGGPAPGSAHGVRCGGGTTRGPGLRRGGQPPRRQLYARAREYLSLVGVRRITP